MNSHKNVQGVFLRFSIPLILFLMLTASPFSLIADTGISQRFEGENFQRERLIEIFEPLPKSVREAAGKEPLALNMNIAGSLSASAQAGPLFLDPTFGTGGKVVTHFLGEEAGSNVALQPDGRIVVGGTIFVSDLTGIDFLVARYNLDGSLDTSFGMGGKAITDFFSNDDQLLDLVVQPDGKIVVAGFASPSASSSQFALARYNTDGSLDTSFGAGGKVTTSFGALDRCRALALQPDGRIVAAGFTIPVSDEFTEGNFALARYNTDGSLDTSFGASGKVITDFFGDSDTAFSIARQPDGKIVAAGAATQIGGNIDFALARYNTNGSLDTSFGMGGKVATDFMFSDDRCNAMVLQPDGKIIGAGNISLTATNGFDFLIARYNGDGSLDTSFGAGGKTVIDFFGHEDRILDLVLQPNGRIIAAGFAVIERPFFGDFAFARYNDDGSPDTSFGPMGKTTTSFGHVSRAAGMALQSDGKIVVAGFAPGTTNFDIAVARYIDAVFDACIQNDGNGNVIQIDSVAGAYIFTSCSDGFTLSGIGQVTRKGCLIVLQDNKFDRRVIAKIDACQKKASASIQVLSPSRIFSLIDRDTSNNTCSCP